MFDVNNDVRSVTQFPFNGALAANVHTHTQITAYNIPFFHFFRFLVSSVLQINCAQVNHNGADGNIKYALGLDDFAFDLVKSEIKRKQSNELQYILAVVCVRIKRKLICCVANQDANN